MKQIRTVTGNLKLSVNITGRLHFCVPSAENNIFSKKNKWMFYRAIGLGDGLVSDKPVLIVRVCRCEIGYFDLKFLTEEGRMEIGLHS